MELSLPAPSPRVGLFLAQQLMILRAGTNPSSIGVNIAADTGRANSQGDIPANAWYPRGWWVRDANQTFIFISGSENLGQATNYVHYLSGPRSGNIAGKPAIRYLSDAADHYLEPIAASDAGQNGTLLMAGHSLGGALAQAVIKTAAIRTLRSAQACVTFGSPKIIHRPNQDFYSGLNITRWMGNDDPVPLVPPSVVTNIQALASLFPLTLENWSNTLQLAGGVSMNSDGTTEDSPTPPMGSINFAASLANWLWDIYNGRETVHDLPTYVARLGNVVTRTNPPLSARVVESGPEPRTSISRRDANRSIQEGIDSIIRVASAQNAARLAVPPQRAFRPVKIGPIWWVTFGGQLVAVGPRRRNCGLMCVRGNAFLTRLQRMGGVDGAALAGLLVDYIAAASTPDNGFSPTIARLD